MYTQSKNMAQTQATWVELSKKTKMADHLESAHPAVESSLLHSSLISLLVRPFYLELWPLYLC